ncbi:MAG: glycosyltransferase family 87 protein [Roseiarcus sp.]
MNDKNAVVASREPLRLARLIDFAGSIDRRVVVAFLVIVGLFLADVVLPELVGGGKTKDYELWFQTGRAVLDGQDIYARRPDGLLKFLYTPFSAVLLAPLALLGKPLMYAALALINAAAWIVVVACTQALCSFAPRAAVGYVLPSAITLPLIFLTFDLGQPNLLLLAFVLSGFLAIENNRSGLGGALIAAAAAMKAFPVAIVLYLLARKQWRAAASMILALAFFTFVVPAAVLGPTKAASDLTTWTAAMTSVDAKVFGQRPNHNWSYRNQSLFALTHRLTRPVDAAESEEPQGAVAIDVVDLGFAGANRVYVALCCLIGGAFLFLLLKSDPRKRRVRICELGVLLCLDVVASPEAHDYYFVWLIFPIAVLIDLWRAERSGHNRKIVAFLSAGAVACMAVTIKGLPVVFQAYGCLLWAVALLISALVFAMFSFQQGVDDPSRVRWSP